MLILFEIYFFILCKNCLFIFFQVSHVVQEINENVNLIKLIQDNSLNYHPNKRISLIGLHTCGSLAHSLIKAFVRTKEISTLCIVPCCYHLTDESLSGRYQFTKNSRMLAQQSVERSSNKKETLPISLFYRAVLQVILKKAGNVMDRNEKI